VKNRNLILLAVALGVVVVLLINARFSDLEAKANPPTTTFFEALVDIEPGLKLSDAVGKLRLLRPVKEVPEGFAREYPDAVDAAEYAAHEGDEIARTVRAGAFLRMGDLRPLTSAEISARIPAGHLAVSVAVSAETSVGYLVAPGDRVDVFLVKVVRDPDASGGTRGKAELVGSDLNVFAVDRLVQPEAGARSPVRFRGEAFRTVTLTGRPEDLTRLLEARAEGTLTLALRAAGR
jgi:Flp pilus assembly protein CpaB